MVDRDRVWHNREQELFMNCAAVEITGPTKTEKKTTPTADSVPVFNKHRPRMLFANNGKGCLSPLTTAELKYPHPRPDVFMGDGEYPLELPGPKNLCE